jgi:tripeptidyl-peptidase-1
VSILGKAYVIVDGRAFNYESGTSASAPVFGGMISLINDHRIANGKSPLGFLNTALYKLPATVWHDITKGRNHCTATTAVCCQQGFYAAPGWDPVTGLGSPRFQSLLAALG